MRSYDGIGFEALGEQIAADLACLSWPERPWVGTPNRPVAGEVLNCAIVGGGQFGLTLVFGLARERVDKVAVFDRNPAGFEGPWMTFARMEMLRTPKDLTGPDLGIPSLTFRAWYTAQHGAAAWDALFRIRRTDWMDYLRWYRETLDLDVRNEAAVTRLEPLAPDLLRLTVEQGGETRRVLARTVVIATGAEGSGGRVVPDFIRDSLPAALYAHTNDPIDFAALAGKRVGILGAGASSFDCAIAALEAGAAEAQLCFRRPALPLQNPRRWMEFNGFLAHYPSLPDAQKWAYMQRLYTISQPPPKPTFDRAVALPGFRLRPATPWDRVQTPDGATVEVESKGERLAFDFVIAGTGIAVDLSWRPEMADLLPGIALWRDRYTPPAELADARLAGFPYLGPHGEFTEREPGTAPWLARVFTITRGATMSLGPSSASNSNIKYTAPRIISGVTRQLFLDHARGYFDAFMNQRHDELDATAVKSAGAA
jgi:cation diffusion facilitator CzcD-associated flavoprotein CzcO